MASDELRQRFEALENEVLPLTDSPSSAAIRRDGAADALSTPPRSCRRYCLARPDGPRRRAVGDPGRGRAGRAGADDPADKPPADHLGAGDLDGPADHCQAPTQGRATRHRRCGRQHTAPPGRAGRIVFGAGERDALDQLARRLGAPDERGSWNGATPFGTCPGPVRAVRWGRLYVLFTNGATRYAASGRWHLFAYQVDAVQRTKLDPTYSGPPPPPEPPPLRGYSPRTAAGIGFGSTLAQLREAYGHLVDVSYGEPGMIYRVRVSFGATGELFGSLSGGTPEAIVTWIAAGAICGE